MHESRCPCVKNNGMKNKLKFLEPWLWLLPSLVCIFAFVIFPFIKTIYSSFFIIRKDGSFASFVGVDNYKLLLNDPIFHSAIKNTVLFTIETVPTVLIVGFIFAVFSIKKCALSLFYELLLSIPCAVSLSVAAMIFQSMYNPNLGIINKLLGLNINWLYDERYALLALSVIQIWSSSAFAYIFFLNALRNIPKHYIDYAYVEGATLIQLVKYVYIPFCIPTSIYLLFANVSTSMMMMSLSNVLTNGGPQNSTVTLIYYIYSKFVSTGNLTITNAAAIIYFITSFLIYSGLFVFWKKSRDTTI